MSTAPLVAALTNLRKEAVERSDRQLLDAYAVANDQSAFAALVRRHGPMVLGVCRRLLRDLHDAEDAFQATFLVLARGVHSIRKGDSLSGWLHGVCYRVAMRAKRDAARRRQHEGRVPPRTEAPAWETGWRELQIVLDEEVEQLPPAYRTAFVLCCLDGLSKPEAARRLGVNENTVSSRLARARKQMRERLACRGISLSAVLAALAVSGRGRAAVPATLARTGGAAARLGAGPPVTGLSAKALSLAEGVTRTMLPKKFKMANVLILTLCALGTGLTVLGRPAPTSKDPPPAKTDRPATGTKLEPAKGQKDGSLEVGGRVLDPEDKPVEGARIYLLDQTVSERAPAVRATSAAEGRFRFTVPPKENPLHGGVYQPWRYVFVVAMAKGFGPALAALGDPTAADKQTLRLGRDDVPIKGRVLDLEGRPVAGAKVVVEALMVPNKGDLTAFLASLEASKDGYPSENEFLTSLHGQGIDRLFPEVTADKEGRFELRGIGWERVVNLTISGPTIETKQVRVRTRPGKTLERLEWKQYHTTGTLTYYGSTFEHAAAPTRPVVGVVRDKDTGKPIAGATVQSMMLAGDNLYGRTFIRTTTDRDGRYRLVGLPKGEGNLIRAVPAPGPAFAPVEKRVPNPPGLEVATVDFELKRGVWIKGRVLDKVTGKPVRGSVEYFVFRDNPNLKDFPRIGLNNHNESDASGHFRFIGLPGRALIAVRAHGDRYVTGVGAERYKERDQFGHIVGTSPLCLANGYHTLIEIDPAKDAESTSCEIVLDPGRTPSGTVLGPDGKPLAGARVCGLASYASTYWGYEPLRTAEYTVFGVSKDRPRTLLFLHEGTKMAGSLRLKGDEKGPLEVRLKPWGTLKGRLVRAGGEPRTGADLMFLLGNRFDDPDRGTHPTRHFPIGKDGTFRIEGLVPGMKYDLGVLEKGMIVGSIFKDLTIKAGQTKDLGDVQVGE
ncbi:MAG: sigma-70 family RNA polymerase sigma factor [Planctomycetes bacterium]|nr:sigma-70 family RNA polymerase sigma factor [Planctomycetota bacterium]